MWFTVLWRLNKYIHIEKKSYKNIYKGLAASQA